MSRSPGKNISHLTRVNSSSNSSKTIVPRKIIEGLNLRFDDDYQEWRMEMRGGLKWPPFDSLGDDSTEFHLK
jgi:hypothetical protein